MVELLVTLAVLSVLVTISIPALYETRENTISTACKANLSQLYIWSSIYTKENDHQYMSQPNTLFTNDWQSILTDSNKNRKALLCPKVPELYPKHADSSYGLSLILKDKFANKASAPSTTLMFGDGEKYSSTTQQGLNWWKKSLERHSLQASDLIHLRKMNLNYLDGSVDSKNYHEMKQSEPLWKF